MNENLMNKQKTNTNTTDGVVDIIEGVAECLTDADAISDGAGETVEIVGDAADAVGDVVGGILDGIFEGLDDLPAIAIAGVVLVGVGVVAGIGFLGHKLLKKKK